MKVKSTSSACSCILFFVFLLILHTTQAASEYIRINEVASTGDFEFVELYNAGDEDIIADAGWFLLDSVEALYDNDPPLYIPEGTRIPSKGFLLVAPYKSTGLNRRNVPEEIPQEAVSANTFAIGSVDSITLYHGNEMIDYLEWETDINSLGRYPDGSSGAFQELSPTPGSPNRQEQYLQFDNAANPGPEGRIVINEVCSSGIDFIELYNPGDSRIIIEEGEWVVTDIGKNDFFSLPGGTEIAAKGFLVLYPDFLRLPLSADRRISLPNTEGERFGLGRRDSVFLKWKNRIADSFTWYDHVVSAGRIPDGSENWSTNTRLSPGKTNTEK